MSGRRNKVLRRAAQESTIGWKDVRYENVNGMIKVQKGCAKAYYKELKQLNKQAVPNTSEDLLHRVPHEQLTDEKIKTEELRTFMRGRPSRKIPDKLTRAIHDGLLR